MIERMLTAGLHFLQDDHRNDPRMDLLYAVLDHQEAKYRESARTEAQYTIAEGIIIRVAQVALGAGFALGVHMERRRRKA